MREQSVSYAAASGGNLTAFAVPDAKQQGLTLPYGP